MTRVLRLSARAPARRYTPEEKAEVLAARARGEPYLSIGKRLGRSQGSVWNIAMNVGATVPQSTVSDADAILMRDEYEGPGKPTLEAMAKRWGWSTTAITRAITRTGGKIRPAGHARIVPPDDEIIRLRALGLKAREIAAEWGCKEGAIWGAESRRRARERAGA